MRGGISGVEMASVPSIGWIRSRNGRYMLVSSMDTRILYLCLLGNAHRRSSA
jgi:hypothetical protein